MRRYGWDMLKMKRVYEDFDPDDGWRVLVDRLWPRGIAKSEPDNPPRGCSQGSPDSELCEALAHGVGHHAIDTNTCEQERHSRERQSHEHRETSRRASGRHVIVEWPDVIDRQCRIETADDVANRRNHSHWIATGADHV